MHVLLVARFRRSLHQRLKVSLEGEAAKGNSVVVQRWRLVSESPIVIVTVIEKIADLICFIVCILLR